MYLMWQYICGACISDEFSLVIAGPLSNGNDRNAQDAEHQSEFKPLKAAKECCTKSFKKVVAA